MEEEGVNQKSLTDKEAKLMKNNGSFDVCFNMQVLVESKNQIIGNYEITDNPSDYGSMSGIVEETEEEYKEKVEAMIIWRWRISFPERGNTALKKASIRCRRET